MLRFWTSITSLSSSIVSNDGDTTPARPVGRMFQVFFASRSRPRMLRRAPSVQNRYGFFWRATGVPGLLWTEPQPVEENLTRADGRTDGRRRSASGDSRNYFSPKCFHTDANRARTDNNMARHLRFISRTVMVQQSNVDAAYKTLNR